MARILIVEDNDDNMKLFRTILTLKHHEIIERTDGERLQESLDHERPDLVLMDIQLPGQDGFALLESIRSSTVPDCRVVALTAHAMAGDRERAIQAGFDGYITKPIDIRAFPHQIERALAGETVTD
ncbi:MAG: response regulator [Gemmatimonadales bacterium]